MVTEINVVQQVAEVKCPEGWGEAVPHGIGCATCQGTGLRWPGLSRKCPCAVSLYNIGTRDEECSKCYRPGSHQEGCYACHGSGLIPDVTLEKVLAIMVEDGDAPALVNDDNGHWAVASNGMQPLCYDERHIASSLFIFDEDTVWADTPLEAACAALLAT